MNKFENEEQIEERKQKRQEEWEKVRQPEQPELAPEEPFDGRSLYDRLKEQRDAKDMEFEEARKFKNLIKCLDDDDIDHLEESSNRKLQLERKQQEEELKELEEFRNRVAELQEDSADQRLNQIASKSKTTTSQTPKTSQKAMLSSIIKRKSDSVTQQEPPEKRQNIQAPSALKCVAVLPGIGDYKSSDDSDASSDDDLEFTQTDLTGRQIIKKKSHEEC